MRCILQGKLFILVYNYISRPMMESSSYTALRSQQSFFFMGTCQRKSWVGLSRNDMYVKGQYNHCLPYAPRSIIMEYSLSNHPSHSFFFPLLPHIPIQTQNPHEKSRQANASVYISKLSSHKPKFPASCSRSDFLWLTLSLPTSTNHQNLSSISRYPCSLTNPLPSLNQFRYHFPALTNPNAPLFAFCYHFPIILINYDLFVYPNLVSYTPRSHIPIANT